MNLAGNGRMDGHGCSLLSKCKSAAAPLALRRILRIPLAIEPAGTPRFLLLAPATAQTLTKGEQADAAQQHRPSARLGNYHQSDIIAAGEGRCRRISLVGDLPPLRIPGERTSFIERCRYAIQ